jgi:hypothetical protein
VGRRFLSYEPNNLTITKTIQVNLSTAPPVAEQKYNTAVHIRMYAFVCVCIVTGGPKHKPYTTNCIKGS